MKTKYTWDENLLKRYKANPYLSKELQELYEDIESENKIILPNYLSNLKKDNIFFRTNPFIYPRINSLLNSDTCYLKIQKNKTKITIEEALNLTNSFYGTLDNEIFSAFKIHFANRYTHLKELPFNDGYFSGECFTLEKAKDCLIEFKASKNFAMLGVLIHEYAHATAFTLRNYLMQNSNNSIFTEVESIFIELIAYDFFKKSNMFKTDVSNEMNILYNDALDIFRDTIEVHEICSMVSEMQNNHQKINIHNIIKEAKLNFEDMKSFEVKKLLEIPIEYRLTYGYSYLIAIELYQIYLQNLHEAFDLYKKIIRMQKKTALETYHTLRRMGINAGEHFEEFTNSLKR